MTQRNAITGRPLTRAEIEPHYRKLCDVVRSVVIGEAHPFALSDFGAQAIQRGLPIDPGVLWKDQNVLLAEAHYLALALPSLRALHGDCKAWLAHKLKKPADRIEGTIPWNLALGGQLINASGR